MAKFYLTNNKELYKRTKKHINESEFNLCFDYTGANIFALSTSKLKINNNNAYEAQNGDFVIATGTAIYKESLDCSLVLKDFNDNIKYIREQTIGQYAYIINKKNKITIFGDRIGCYNIYYFIKDGFFFVSNVLWDMALILKEHLTINEMNIIEESSQACILGDETFFYEINRLNGEQTLIVADNIINVIQNNNNIEEKTWNLQSQDSTNGIIDKLSKELRNKSSIITKILGNPTVCMTGGLDSRIILASFLSAGGRPNLSFGKSNTEIAHPEEQDSIIVKQIGEGLGLDYNIHDWDTRNPSKHWDYYLKRYGFSYTIWGACKQIMDFFENSENVICGYFGELFRNIPIQENCLDIINIDTIFNFYSRRCGDASYIPIESIVGYESHLRNKLLNIARKYNLDPNRLSPEDVFYFMIETRKVSDTRTMNLVNLSRYTASPIFEYDVISLTRVKCKEMDNAKFMLSVIDKLYPRVLDFPIFSHCQMRLYDKMNNILVSNDKNKNSFKEFLKNMYHLNEKIFKPIYFIYKKIRDYHQPIQTQPIAHNQLYPVYVENVWDKFLKNKVTYAYKGCCDFRVNIQICHTMICKAITNIFINIR